MITSRAALSIVCLLTTASVCLPVAGATSDAGPPFNRIVVLVDATDSFKPRRLQAIEQTRQLVAQIGSRKAKRWEAADQVIVISLDAIPEILWKGDSHSLAQDSRGDWVTRFKGRGDYARCTDVDAALELALAALETGSRPAGKYLIAFSDLIHEPPLNSPSKCKPPTLPSVPGKNFAWERLTDVAVAAFWLPPNQKLAWDRAMKEHGLANYKLFTTSESATAEIELPRPPVREMTEQERERLLGRLSSGLGGFAMIVGGISALAVLAAFAFAGAVWMRRRRNSGVSPGTAPQAPGGRRIQGPVQPMVLPPRR